MKENVLIIGNGFDLDLGLPTAYSDFVSSDYWPDATKVETNNDSRINCNGEIPDLSLYPLNHKLESVIDEAKKEKWFDLEETLLNYAKKKLDGDSLYDANWGCETELEVANNVKYYKELRESLCNYIKNIQSNNRIRKSSIAGEVLKIVVENGLFKDIYSFNYTDLNVIAKRLNIRTEFQYIHLHGTVSDNSIILGVDETELRSGYELFHKSSSKFYRSNNLYNTLIYANEIVIFGLSFGSIDYSYFNDFFKKISDGEPIPECEKQSITIFTKDEKSHLETTTRLRKMGINIQRLYAQAHFKIICTSNKDDKDVKEALNDFYLRLKQNNKESYLNRQYDLAGL